MRFIDILRSTSNASLDGYLRLAKFLALRDDSDSIDFRELDDWLGEASDPLLAREEYQHMTHFLVKDAPTMNVE